jgi:predicted RNase H-like nuclease (RuvC/YqgF family)
VKRLEALLTKCKESIKANKQKTTALTEVKESLATQLASKEAECNNLSSQLTQLQNDHEVLKKKEQEEELQVCFRLTLKLNYCAICIY